MDQEAIKFAEYMFSVLETEDSLRITSDEFEAMGGREGVKLKGWRLSAQWGDNILLEPNTNF